MECMSYKSLLYERSSGTDRTDGAAVPSREERDRTITWDNGGTENTRPMSGAPAHYLFRGIQSFVSTK